MANRSLDFCPSILNMASFVGALSHVPKDEVSDEARDEGSPENSDDSGSKVDGASDDQFEGDSAGEDIDDVDERDRCDFEFSRKVDMRFPPIAQPPPPKAPQALGSSLMVHFVGSLYRASLISSLLFPKNPTIPKHFRVGMIF